MSKKQARIFWPTLVIAVLFLAVVSLAPRFKSAAQVEPAPPDSGSEPAVRRKPTGQVPKERVEMVQITVRPGGFEPAEIEYPSKPFLLAVDNQSGMDNLGLQLFQEDEGGKSRAKIRELGISLKSLSKREITLLNPGRYVLREVSHPEWVCHLTISEK